MEQSLDAYLEGFHKHRQNCDLKNDPSISGVEHQRCVKVSVCFFLSKRQARHPQLWWNNNNQHQKSNTVLLNYSKEQLMQAVESCIVIEKPSPGTNQESKFLLSVSSP